MKSSRPAVSPRLSASSRFRLVTALALTVAAFAAALVAGCGSSDDDQWKGETIALGSIFSTTGDGAPFGPQQVKGAELAVEEVNGDDGVNGAEITLTQKDDASDPATSAEKMTGLVKDEKVLAVLGPTFSNSAAEADPIANQNKTPVLAVSNTGPGIVGDCDYPCDFIFRDSLGEATAIPANIDNLAAQLGDGSTAAVVYPDDDPFGETSAETAKDALNNAGVVNTTYKINELISLLGKSKKTNVPDLVFITASSGETVADYISQLRGAGYSGLIGGGNAMNSPVVAKAAGAAGKGAQSAAAWYAGNDSEENQEFISAYENKYGEKPDQFAAQAYTGVKLLADAAEDADLTFDDLASDREALKSSLEKVDEETPLGEFSFTADHDVNQPIWIVAMNGKGGYDLVEKVNP